MATSREQDLLEQLKADAVAVRKRASRDERIMTEQVARAQTQRITQKKRYKEQQRKLLKGLTQI
jgi:hypothetical protein